MPVHASQGIQANRGRGVGLGLALVSALAFGGSGVAAKPLIEAGLDPLHVVWLRVAGAARRKQHGATRPTPTGVQRAPPHAGVGRRARAREKT
ncbi:EamA family transporter, partial [Streptomyces sp. NPDC056983]